MGLVVVLSGCLPYLLYLVSWVRGPFRDVVPTSMVLDVFEGMWMRVKIISHGILGFSILKEIWGSNFDF